MNREQRFLFRASVALNLLLLTFQFPLLLHIYVSPQGCSHCKQAGWPSEVVDYRQQGSKARGEVGFSKTSSIIQIPIVDSPRYFVQRGQFYYVTYSKAKASKGFYGNDSITLTTPTDYSRLHNLITLTRRWRGPISVAVYAPGSDYAEALRRIHYLRTCKPLVKELVTFHLFFPRKHIPSRADLIFPRNSTTKMSKKQLCRSKPLFGSNATTYLRTKRIHFPINVARNIARETASTHFVFPCDIELFPNEGIIPDFFRMLRSPNFTRVHGKEGEAPQVFVLPIFELASSVRNYPRNKSELLGMIKKKLTFPFHAAICARCHNIPNLGSWLNSSQHEELGVFTTASRNGVYRYWEPFYIGTKNDPVFDERVTWEGRSNKRIQAYTMCVLGYRYHVLNNAFVVHRPGIKVYPKELDPDFISPINIMNNLINQTIIPEVNALYGTLTGCHI